MFTPNVLCILPIFFIDNWNHEREYIYKKYIYIYIYVILFYELNGDFLSNLPLFTLLYSINQKSSSKLYNVMIVRISFNLKLYVS